MCKRVNLVIKDEVLAPQEWIENLTPSGLLNLLCIPHFGHSPELNAIVKVLLSCLHDGYLWLDCKIELNMGAIYCIIGLRKVGVDPIVHFVGKNLDRKLAVKLMKEFNLSKEGRVYDAANIQDDALRFTIQLLAG